MVFPNLAFSVGMESDLSNTSTLRFGIMGCGGVGPTHAGALLRIEDAQLVATADVKIERAQELAGKLGITRIYKSDDPLLADPDIAVVCIATPSGMHADHSVKAMRAGKHVAVERPMETSSKAWDG